MLKFIYGSRALSLGGAYVAAADDAYYMDSNPAGGDARKVFRASLIHREWIGDTNYEALRLSYGIRDQFFIGLGLTYFYLPFEYYDITGATDGTSYHLSQSLAMVNFGYKLKKYDVAFGVNAKVLYNHVPEDLYADQSYLLYAGGAGFIARTNILKTFIGPEPSMTFGLALRNFGYSEAIDKLPTEVHAGVTYRLFRHLMLSGEFAYPLCEPIYGSVGAEFDIAKTFFIQAGVEIKENPMVGLGVGYRRKDMNINISYTPSMVFRNMMNVSVEFRFGDSAAEARQKEIDKLMLDALVDYNTGNYETALEVIDKVLELDPRNLRAKQLKRTVEKEIELEKSAEKVNGKKDKERLVKSD
jgi:tetratricopeptide (TPR) repeat protein